MLRHELESQWFADILKRFTVEYPNLVDAFLTSQNTTFCSIFGFIVFDELLLS